MRGISKVNNNRVADFSYFSQEIHTVIYEVIIVFLLLPDGIVSIFRL